ncbi:hypothetical protein JJJ17_15675 [Paracoccus caeni]|uniref:Uncharacterized protein n=1 Tax=Paracoccus caeni TaxID=657651 RepID=A0A934W1G4_9RHOB|nr:hypothetical protein [Paracoccus caeni]MBK4217368.1 hypothetical protein [Paracoccus caeni]
MPHDASYRQLLQLLASRAQVWLRMQVQMLPDPLPDDHPELLRLAAAVPIARACSVLRGCRIPLEGFLEERLTADLIERALRAPEPRQVGTLLLAGRHLDLDLARDPRFLATLRTLPDLDPGDRLVLGGDSSVIGEIEQILRTPIPAERLDDHMVDRFAHLLMLIYDFGAIRPRLSSASAYGDIFANCLRFADWAQAKRRLSPLAQMIFCLSLIDPDHDVAPLLGETISCQRPDGSFPKWIGYGNVDQDLQMGLTPTLAAIAALFIVAHRNWDDPNSASALPGYALQHC